MSNNVSSFEGVYDPLQIFDEATLQMLQNPSDADFMFFQFSNAVDKSNEDGVPQDQPLTPQEAESFESVQQSFEPAQQPIEPVQEVQLLSPVQNQEPVTQDYVQQSHVQYGTQQPIKQFQPVQQIRELVQPVQQQPVQQQPVQQQPAQQLQQLVQPVQQTQTVQYDTQTIQQFDHQDFVNLQQLENSLPQSYDYSQINTYPAHYLELAQQQPQESVQPVQTFQCLDTAQQHYLTHPLLLEQPVEFPVRDVAEAPETVETQTIDNPILSPDKFKDWEHQTNFYSALSFAPHDKQIHNCNLTNIKDDYAKIQCESKLVRDLLYAMFPNPYWSMFDVEGQEKSPEKEKPHQYRYTWGRKEDVYSSMWYRIDTYGNEREGGERFCALCKSWHKTRNHSWANHQSSAHGISAVTKSIYPFPTAVILDKKSQEPDRSKKPKTANDLKLKGWCKKCKSYIHLFNKQSGSKYTTWFRHQDAHIRQEMQQKRGGKILTPNNPRNSKKRTITDVESSPEAVPGTSRDPVREKRHRFEVPTEEYGQYTTDNQKGKEKEDHVTVTHVQQVQQIQQVQYFQPTQTVQTVNQQPIQTVQQQPILAVQVQSVPLQQYQQQVQQPAQNYQQSVQHPTQPIYTRQAVNTVKEIEASNSNICATSSTNINPVIDTNTDTAPVQVRSNTSTPTLNGDTHLIDFKEMFDDIDWSSFDSEFVTKE